MSVISIDVSSIPPRPAGAGRYGIELLRGLAGVTRPGLEVATVTSGSNAAFFDGVAPLGSIAVSPSNRVLRLLWEQTVLPGRLASRGVDLHHGLHYTLPHRFHGARVSTIHDMTFLDHPEWHERTKVELFRRSIAYACRHADAIVVPSHSTAAALRRHFVPTGRVEVIHHGFTPRLLCDDIPRRDVREGAILFVGTIEPRKGVEVLVEAFERLNSGGASYELDIVGQVGWKAEGILGRISSSSYAGRIRVHGYVGDTELGELFNRASVFVYPSLEEGFGLPVLEAMALGVPVVTTSGSSMAEIADGSALLAAPGDSAGIVAAVEAVRHGGAAIERMVLDGVERASTFTWERSALEHLRLYDTVLKPQGVES